jgi:hypothetical protein
LDEKRGVKLVLRKGWRRVSKRGLKKARMKEMRREHLMGSLMEWWREFQWGRKLEHLWVDWWVDLKELHSVGLWVVSGLPWAVQWGTRTGPH